jgi:hypothetical protein
MPSFGETETFVFRKEINSDAVLDRLGVPQTITSDAYIQGPTNQTIDSDAYIKKETEETINSDAYIVGQTQTKTINSDAEIKDTSEEVIYSDMEIITGARINSNAYIKGTQEETILSDAWIFQPGESVFYSNAYIKATLTKTIYSDAYVIKGGQVNIPSDAWIRRTEEETLTSDAWVYRISTPLNIFPLDGEDFNISDSTERIRFNIPNDISGTDNIHLHIQLALDADFVQVVFERYTWQDTSIWTYYNGTGFVEFPTAGIPPSEQGAECRVNIFGQISLHQPILYWRVRGVIR